MLASIVLNLMNEEKNIADLLDSLVVQEGPIEIIVVDAGSKDLTRDIVQSYEKLYPFVKLYIKPGRRGESTNYGVSLAKGEIIMFTGGTCIANPFWVKEMRSAVKGGASVVVGRTINIGYQPWESLDRVELYHKGNDISYPSCNEAFSREAITKAGGFDSWFITAEDIDLNLRAVDAGFDIVYDTNAVIYHRTKATLYRFFKQAFWNGAGRKQLTMKHGKLWGSYDPLKMFKQKMTMWAFIRLFVAMMGYVGFKFFGDKLPATS